MSYHLTVRLEGLAPTVRHDVINVTSSRDGLSIQGMICEGATG